MDTDTQPLREERFFNFYQALANAQVRAMLAAEAHLHLLRKVQHGPRRKKKLGQKNEALHRAG